MATGGHPAAKEAPLQRLEHVWHMPVAYLVIPIFALANAGIALDLSAVGATLAHPVVLGVMLGLALGKFIGITGVCWLMLKLGVAQLPRGTRFTQIAGVSLLAGSGLPCPSLSPSLASSTALSCC